MSTKVDFDALRRVGYAMTVDIIVAIAGLMIFELDHSGSNVIYNYISWTVPAVRSICHIQILSSLFRLKELNPEYRHAQIMYAAHIILFAVSWGLAGLLSAKVDYTYKTTTVPYLILVALYLADGMANGLGDWAILRGTAYTLRSFGLMKRAAKNIRVGTILIIATALLAFSTGTTLVIFFIYLRPTGGTEPEFSEVYSQGAVVALTILIMLVAFTGIFTLICCLIAAGGMRRSYKELKELTK